MTELTEIFSVISKTLVYDRKMTEKINPVLPIRHGLIGFDDFVIIPNKFVLLHFKAIFLLP